MTALELIPFEDPLECSRCGCRHFIGHDVTESERRFKVRAECRNCGRWATRRIDKANLTGCPEIDGG